MTPKEIFKSNTKFLAYKRSGVVFYTSNLEEAYQLVTNGWHFLLCDDGFRLNPPSVTICDITDCNKANQYYNTVFNLAYFRFLKKKIENGMFHNFMKTILVENEFYYKNFYYHVSSGPILEAEIKLEGTDQRLLSLKKDMVKSFINHPEYKEYYIGVERTGITNKLFQLMGQDYDCMPDNLKSFYQNIMDVNAILKKGCKCNYDIPEMSLELFEKIEYDVLLFIPNGCYKFMNMFINEKNIDKVMFYEYHIDKTKKQTFKLFEKELKNKRVLVVDSVYSGNTLFQMKSLLEEKYKARPILFGVYPKSLGVIKKMDYVMILNQIYRVSEIQIEKDYLENCYIESLKL